MDMAIVGGNDTQDLCQLNDLVKDFSENKLLKWLMDVIKTMDNWLNLKPQNGLRPLKSPDFSLVTVYFAECVHGV